MFIMQVNYLLIKTYNKSFSISTKIFEKFLELGGIYIKQNVTNLIQKENSIEISLGKQKLILIK